MKILITAFEPFGGESVNPAQEAVALVKDRIANAQIVKFIRQNPGKSGIRRADASA